MRRSPADRNRVEQPGRPVPQVNLNRLRLVRYRSDVEQPIAINVAQRDRLSAGGGLEHLNSASLGYPRFGFKVAPGDRATSSGPNTNQQPERDYRGFLSLVAHEFFHLWNVKRIRPDALGPFDYNNENYTKVLWVAEGITDYYADIALRRAKRRSIKRLMAV